MRSQSDPYSFQPISLLKPPKTSDSRFSRAGAILLFIPVALYLLVVLIAISPFLLFLWLRGLIDRQREAKFLDRMRDMNRAMTWEEIRGTIDEKRGTIIVERRGRGGMSRHWWTPDDLSICSPHPLPKSESAKTQDEGFYEWAYQRYAEPTLGTAFFFVIPRGTVLEACQRFEKALCVELVSPGTKWGAAR